MAPRPENATSLPHMATNQSTFALLWRMTHSPLGSGLVAGHRAGLLGVADRQQVVQQRERLAEQLGGWLEAHARRIVTLAGSPPA